MVKGSYRDRNNFACSNNSYGYSGDGASNFKEIEPKITEEGSGSIVYSTATPESVKKANNPFAALLNLKLS